MNDESLKTACETIHGYLTGKLGHNWRYPVWEKKYAARLRSYSLEECLTAIDGFCGQPWYVNNQSQNAPDLIFRSDRQLEKFLAFGKRVRRDAADTNTAADRKRETEDRQTAIRDRLTRDNAALNGRLQRKLAVLRERLNERSYGAWISPLLYAGKREDGTVVLFHEQASWVAENYRDIIGQALGRPVIITNEIS